MVRTKVPTKTSNNFSVLSIAFGCLAGIWVAVNYATSLTTGAASVAGGLAAGVGKMYIQTKF